MHMHASTDKWNQRIRPVARRFGEAHERWRSPPPRATDGRIPASPTITHWDGRIEAFGRGEDDGIWSRCRPPPPADAWTPWETLGGAMASEPAAVMTAAGLTHLFAQGRDGALWHRWRPAGGRNWSIWGSLGAPSPGAFIPDAPVALVNLDGRVEVFVRGNGAAPMHLRQTGCAPSDWSAWKPLDPSLWGV